MTKLDTGQIIVPLVPEDKRQMRPTTISGYDRPESIRTGRAIWIVLIVTSGACLSVFFACATPFAALATLAGLKLNRRDAIAVLSLVWGANQAIGYGFLGYPCTWDSAAWGVAIGASAGLAVVVARGLSTTRPAPLVVSLPFTAAFVTFELCLYIAGFMLPGSNGAFTASVVGHLFLINAIALCALVAVHHFAVLVGPLARQDTPASGSVGGAAFS